MVHSGVSTTSAIHPQSSPAFVLLSFAYTQRTLCSPSPKTSMDLLLQLVIPETYPVSSPSTDTDSPSVLISPSIPSHDVFHLNSTRISPSKLTSTHDSCFLVIAPLRNVHPPSAFSTSHSASPPNSHVAPPKISSSFSKTSTNSVLLISNPEADIIARTRTISPNPT